MCDENYKEEDQKQTNRTDSIKEITEVADIPPSYLSNFIGSLETDNAISVLEQSLERSLLATRNPPAISSHGVERHARHLALLAVWQHRETSGVH